MSNFFTLRRWQTDSFQMYQTAFLAWASMWQVIENPPDPARGLSIANLVGACLALFGLHIQDKELSKSVERWAYVAVVWSMSAYLTMALHIEGWKGLVVQPNFGVTLSMAVVFAAIHRMIYTLLVKRWKNWRVQRLARRMAQRA